MDINVGKAFLIKELEQVEDVSLLKAIKAMLHYDLMNDGRISPEQYNRELEKAENRIDNGEFFTQDEVEKIVKNGSEKNLHDQL